MNNILYGNTNQDLIQLQLLVSMHCDKRITTPYDDKKRYESSNLIEVKSMTICKIQNESILRKFGLLNFDNYSIQQGRDIREILAMSNPLLKYYPITIGMTIPEIESEIRIVISRMINKFHNALLEHIIDIEDLYYERKGVGITQIEEEYYGNFREQIAMIHYFYDFRPIRKKDIIKYSPENFNQLRREHNFFIPSIPEINDFNYKMLIDMLSYPAKVSEYYQNQGIYVPLTNSAYSEEDIYDMCGMNSVEEVEIFDILMNYCRERGILPTVKKLFNEDPYEINGEAINIIKQLIFDNTEDIIRHVPTGRIEFIKRNGTTERDDTPVVEVVRNDMEVIIID